MKMLNVSSSPHVRDKDDTRGIMQDVCIAMLPTAAYGVVQFGISALLVMVVTVAAAVISEFLWQKGMKKTVTISDFSAVVTGMILALNMPPGDPALDPGPRRGLRDHHRKADVRRPRPELDEPGTGRTLLPHHFLREVHEQLQLEAPGL